MRYPNAVSCAADQQSCIRDLYVDAFRVACSAAHPSARLWLADYAVEGDVSLDGSGPNPKADGLLRLAKAIRARGPIDGVVLRHTFATAGAHGSCRTRSAGPDQGGAARNMARYRAQGLLVRLSEVDVTMCIEHGRVDVLCDSAAERAKRAPVMGDIYTMLARVCARAGNCTQLTTWGVSDRSTWLVDQLGYRAQTPLLFDAEFRAKLGHRRSWPPSGVGLRYRPGSCRIREGSASALTCPDRCPA